MYEIQLVFKATSGAILPTKDYHICFAEATKLGLKHQEVLAAQVLRQSAVIAGDAQ